MHILAGRLPTGFKKAAGQECQVTLEITSQLNIVGTHSVILLIFFFLISLLETLTFTILNSWVAGETVLVSSYMNTSEE